MSDKNLSGEEKRAKMKEEFKKELRARKEFQEKVKHLRSTQRINDALSNMSVEDDTDDWVNKLNQETAFMEAKVELTMDSANVINVPIEGPDGEVDPPALTMEASEEEMRKLAAEELVAQMKAEMAAEQGESPFTPPIPEKAEKESPSEEGEPMISKTDFGVVEASAEAEEGSEDADRPFRKMMDHPDE